MNLSFNFIGKSSYKWIGIGLKQLPVNLQNLALYFHECKLGEYAENYWFLGEAL